MPFEKVLALAQLSPDSTVEVLIQGSPIVLCHAGGEIHALGGICPHRGGPLGYGAINGDSVSCPWHGWEFNCVTGRNDFDPDTRVATYPVKIEDGDILVDLDAELPEVETVMRSLLPHLQGRVIRRAEFRQMRVLRGDPEDTARRLVGRKITGLERRGKFIMMHLGSGGGIFTVHLGMTGKLLMGGEISKHTHAIVQLDRGVLTYDDPRQFGRLEWSEGTPRSVAKLGPEPLLVEFDVFWKKLHVRKTKVKALLLDQKFLGGVGNIYADEALFRAGIHPLALASKISRMRARRLYDAVREVLSEAIESRGSSVSDYVDADGRLGSFQQSHRVYQRHGEACLVCGRPIRRTLVAQRGTHYCAHCQKR